MKVRMIVLSTLAAATLAMMGCSNKTQAERDSLLKQNQDLQAQLAASKQAEQDAEARAAAAANQTPATPAPTVAEGPSTPDMSPPTDMSPTDGGGKVTDMGGGLKRGHNAMGEDTLTVSSDVLFDSGKATLKATAKKALDKAASILKSEYASRQIRVEGYTDPNPVKKSGWDDNWDLGAARARAVLLYLETRGIHNMYIASFGATQLKSSKNLAEDRRVEIVVVRGGK